MLNHLMTCRAWILRKIPGSFVNPDFFAGQTASEFDAFERDLTRRLAGAEAH